MRLGLVIGDGFDMRPPIPLLGTHERWKCVPSLVHYLFKLKPLTIACYRVCIHTKDVLVSAMSEEMNVFTGLLQLRVS